MSEAFNRDQAVALACSITSAVTTAELAALADAVLSLPDKPVVVEIGSYLGRSSTVLGLATQSMNGDFHMIDPFYETDVLECEKNVRSRGVTNLTIHHCRSEEAFPDFKKDIDLLFDDGDHNEYGVQWDCDHWLSKVKSGGIVAFHDYQSSWTDVRKVVDTRSEITLIRITDSLAIYRKI